VPALILVAGGAAAIAVEAGQWVSAARVQRSAKHIAISHRISIAVGLGES
jgi:hypothetical protein